MTPDAHPATDTSTAQDRDAAPRTPWTVDGARLLRVVAGVDERLLDLVPTERPRYTSLGALVVGTATLGAMSMWVGLNEVSDAGWLLSIALIIPAIVWGAFVLVMDRALITSAGGSAWWSRIPALIIRFVLAGALGLVIAEPLVLQLFHSAVEQEIGDRRAADVDALRDHLLRCNPLPGTPAAPGLALDCTGALIDVGSGFGGTAAQMTALRADEKGLQNQVDTITAEHDRLVDLAQKECAGTPGRGLTGVPGRGFECNQDYQSAADYAASHPLGPLNDRLATTRDQIAKLGGAVATGTNAFETARNAFVAQRVQQLIDHQGGIGLLERFASLSRLVDSQPALQIREWFIRLALVLVDLLPVLVKFLGGATAYDRCVDRENGSDQAIHNVMCEVREHTLISGLRLEKDRLQADNEREMRRINAEGEADEEHQIKQARARYLRASRNGTSVS